MRGIRQLGRERPRPLVLVIDQDPPVHHHGQAARQPRPAAIGGQRHGEHVDVDRRRLARAGRRGDLIGPPAVLQQRVQQPLLPPERPAAAVERGEERREVRALHQGLPPGAAAAQAGGRDVAGHQQPAAEVPALPDRLDHPVPGHAGQPQHRPVRPDHRVLIDLVRVPAHLAGPQRLDRDHVRPGGADRVGEVLVVPAAPAPRPGQPVRPRVLPGERQRQQGSVGECPARVAARVRDGGGPGLPHPFQARCRRLPELPAGKLPHGCLVDPGGAAARAAQR